MTFFYWVTFLVCGGRLVGPPNGAIKSPGYPGRYPHGRDCQWVVEVAAGRRIQFHFTVLAIETHTNCSYDYVQVHFISTLHSF